MLELRGRGALCCLPRQADPRHACLCVCVSTGKGTYSQRISDYFGCACTLVGAACGCCLSSVGSPLLSRSCSRVAVGGARPTCEGLRPTAFQIASFTYCHEADGSLVMAVCACCLPIKQADQHHHGRPAAQRDAGGQPAGPRGKAGCCPTVPCAAKLTSCCLRAS